MTYFRRQLTLAAPPPVVYAALATEAGLRRWWTQTCKVDAWEGGRAVFRFGPHYKTMLIERLDEAREVRWRCEEAHIAVAGMPPGEWVGTTIVFQLSSGGREDTQLDVQHVGLVPALACWELCRAGWDDFLGSLKALVEEGVGRPFIPPIHAPPVHEPRRSPRAQSSV